MKPASLLWLIVVAAVSDAQAAPADFACSGTDPEWQLDIGADSATFTFPAPTQMDIPHRAVAEGQDWPKALTLIGTRDTAIVILHNRQCGSAPVEVQVLTQRAQTPILLSGCCEVRSSPD